MKPHRENLLSFANAFNSLLSESGDELVSRIRNEQDVSRSRKRTGLKNSFISATTAEDWDPVLQRTKLKSRTEGRSKSLRTSRMQSKSTGTAPIMPRMSKLRHQNKHSSPRWGALGFYIALSEGNVYGALNPDTVELSQPTEGIRKGGVGIAKQLSRGSLGIFSARVYYEVISMFIPLTTGPVKKKDDYPINVNLFPPTLALLCIPFSTPLRARRQSLVAPPTAPTNYIHPPHSASTSPLFRCGRTTAKKKSLRPPQRASLPQPLAAAPRR